MTKEKFCKDCKERNKGGLCESKKTFVPRKVSKEDGFNPAEFCAHFSKGRKK